MTHPTKDSSPSKTDAAADALKRSAPASGDHGANPADDVKPDADPHVDDQLDKGLKETFPASDPVSINPGAD